MIPRKVTVWPSPAAECAFGEDACGELRFHTVLLPPETELCWRVLVFEATDGPVVPWEDL